MKDNIMIVNVARDFSAFPAGRYLTDGPYSGEHFLKGNLLPALRQADKVRIVLDGAMGYGSSFLEEAFGGLVRLKDWPLADLLERIKLVSLEEPALVDEIKGYMREAAK